MSDHEPLELRVRRDQAVLERDGPREGGELYWVRWRGDRRWTTLHAPRPVPRDAMMGGDGFLCGLPCPEDAARLTVEWWRVSLAEDGSVATSRLLVAGRGEAGQPMKPCRACALAVLRGEPGEPWVPGVNLASVR